MNKYGWCDMGSSFLPSEFNAAYLLAQLEQMDDIQNRRKLIWKRYYDELKCLKDCGFVIPDIPEYATNNAHIFYLICPSLDVRTRIISFLKEHGILATFHYLPLHSSEYYKEKHDGRKLPNCDRYADCLVRLPLYYELGDEEVDYIINNVKTFVAAL